MRGIGVQVVASRRLEITPAFWRFDLRSPFWRIYVHDRDGAAVTCDGRRLAIPHDRICVIPAHVHFTTATAVDLVQDHIHAEVLGFPHSLHARLFDRPVLLPADRVLAALAARWRSQLKAVHRARGGPFVQPQPEAVDAGPDLVDFAWAAAVVEAVLATLLAELPADEHRTCHDWLAGSNDLRPALDAIDRRLAEPPRNRELASLCRLSENQFIRRFRAMMGVTPARYGLERRLEAGCGMLCRTAMPVTAVAAAAGFVDRPHFVRCFRRRYGVTPATYRQQSAPG